MTLARSTEQLRALLEQGDLSMDEIVAARRKARYGETLRRCAVVRTFDEELVATILFDGIEGALPFAELAELPDVEAVPRRPGVHRLRDTVRSELWREWWTEHPDVRPSELPEPLRTLLERLEAYFDKRERPLDRLLALVCLNPAAAEALFVELYREADRVFDLPACQDLVDVLADTDRGPLLAPRLHELRNDHQGYLRARGRWSTEFMQTARYLEPPGAKNAYAKLIAGDGPRVLNLHARGGRGKSLQLQWLIARQLVPAEELGGMAGGRVPCAKVDFDFVDPVQATRNPWLVLVEIAAQLDDQLANSPFTTFLEEYGWAVPLLHGSTADADLVSAAAKRFETSSGPPTEVVGRFTAILQAVGAARHVVLMFDTLEEIHLRPEGDLHSLLGLLDELMDAVPSLRIVLAGRYKVTEILRRVANRLPPMLELAVKAFTAQQSHRYLAELRGLPPGPVLDALADKADGDPFLLSMLADVVQERPLTSAQEIGDYPADVIYLIRRVIRRIPEPGVRWLVRYGVIPRVLTRSLITDVMAPYLERAMSGGGTEDEPSEDEFADPADPLFASDALPLGQRLDLDALWEDLRRYAGSTAWVSAVPRAQDALRFRAEVIEPMREVVRHHPVYELLHRDALAYFEQRAETDWEEGTRNAIFHRFQLDGPKAAVHWRQALKDAGGDPARREVIAAEVLGPEYLQDGVPLTWTDGRPLLDRAVLLDARLAHCVALAELARGRGVAPDDPRWNQVERSYAELRELIDDKHTAAAPSLAFVEGALSLRSGDVNAAERAARVALPGADDPIDRLRLEVLLGDAALVCGRHGDAADAYERALVAADRAVSPPTWLPTLRRALVLVKADVDELDDALAEYEHALQETPGKHDRAELQLLAGQINLRCGRFAAADRLARDAAARGSTDARRLCVQAALARLDAPSQLPNSSEAIGRALAAMLEREPAVRALSLAQEEARKAGESQQVLHCINLLAAFELREIGDLHAARQRLDEAGAVPAPLASDAWVGSRLLRAELGARAGDDATPALRTLWKSLTESDAPPRRRVEFAAAMLAFGAPEEHAAALDVLLRECERIRPASARIVALAALRHVPEAVAFPGDPRLDELLRLLDVAGDRCLDPRDRAVLGLTLAEVHRLAGDLDAAADEVSATFDALSKYASDPFWLRRYQQTLARVAPTAVASARVAYRFDDAFARFPLLCAAYAVEAAEAALRTGRSAAHDLDRAERALERAGARPTQWHVRLALARAAADPVGDDEVSPWTARAREAARELGLTVVEVESSAATDQLFASLRGRRVDLPLLAAAAEPPGRFVEEWSENPRRAMQSLTTRALRSSSPDHFGSDVAELRLVALARDLRALPWELVLAERTRAAIVRTGSGELAIRDEVAFLQATLNRFDASPLHVDGFAGPATLAALRRHGLPGDGTLNDAFLERLQSDAAGITRPRVVLLRAGSGLEVRSRGKASTGVDLARMYEFAGFEVHVFERPTMDAVRSLTTGIPTHGAPATVVHLSGNMRESYGSASFTFLGGTWYEESLGSAHEQDDFPVAGLDAVLGELALAAGRPIVVLDLDSSFTGRETMTQLLLRNEFAAALFELGHTAAVFATGLAAYDALEANERLTSGLGGGASLVEIAARLQAMPAIADEPGTDATALFTNVPWLRINPH